jgi:hypothetical protein
MMFRALTKAKAGAAGIGAGSAGSSFADGVTVANPNQVQYDNSNGTMRQAVASCVSSQLVRSVLTCCVVCHCFSRMLVPPWTLSNFCHSAQHWHIALLVYDGMAQSMQALLCKRPYGDY